MPNLMTQGIKHIMPGAFALFLALAVACGSPAATTENAPSSPVTAAPASTAVPPQSSPTSGAAEQPAAAAVPQKSSPATGAAEQPAVAAEPSQSSPTSGAAEQPAAPTVASEPAPVDVGERPTLKVGVIWLSTPMDPVESGWVPSQSGLSENLFRLSAADMSPEPWLAT